MVDVTRTFPVRTPLTTVVDYLTDWGNSPEWDPGTITCTKMTDGPVGVGTEWRNVLRFLRRETTMTFRLERAENAQLVFLGQNRTATSTDTITCTTLDDGRTRISYHAHVVFHGVSRLAGPLTTRELERIGDELVGQMTAAVEKLR